MNVGQHLDTLKRNRDSRAEDRERILSFAITENRSMTEAEAERAIELQAEIDTLVADISIYERVEQEQMSNATPINPGPYVQLNRHKDDAFQGQSFTRMVIAKTLGKLEGRSPIAIAQEHWGKTNPRLVEVIKADVSGGGSGSGEWGNELVSQDSYAADFQEYLYGITVYNKLPLREVPANITIKGQDGTGTGYWVGESKAIPVSELDFNDVTLTPLKVAALAVISKELMRDSTPSAEMLVRDGLIEAAAQRIDQTFISTSSAVAGSTPAGILYNIPGTASAGADYDSILNDLKELDGRFITNKNTSGQFYYVMNPLLASSLSFIRSALDQQPFSTVNAQGGTLNGIPVVTGDNVTSTYLIKLKPSDIYRIGMGSMIVEMSDSAAIEMADNPAMDTDTPTAPTGKFVSMFQTESVALKVVQSINFARRRESAVAWISDADYGASIST